MIKYEIKNRFTGDVQFLAEIDCASDERTPIKRRMAVLWALENRADLSEADLSGANLRGSSLRWADLSGADLSGVNLRGANLSGVNLRRADLSGVNLSEINFKQITTKRTPRIKNIHQSVAKAVQGGNKLDMSDWHPECGTKHCRAGWVVVLAGAAGEELEKKLGTSAAAALIYAASDPSLKTVPDSRCSDDEALADRLECAEREVERNTQGSEAVANSCKGGE